MRQRLKGSVTISRVHGDKDVVEIRLEEENSGIEFATLTLELEGFARAITNQGHVKGELEVVGLDKVGWKAENKVEFVPFTGKALEIGHEGLAARRKACLALEVDGWAGDKSDLENHHRRVYKKNRQGAMVRFFRHVKP